MIQGEVIGFQVDSPFDRQWIFITLPEIRY